MVDFDELQAYDVADLLKQYFRELPECLLTNKLSEIFINIFICEYIFMYETYGMIEINSNRMKFKLKYVLKIKYQEY